MNQRLEAVERLAHNVRQSNGKWKKVHTEFINAQFEKAYQAINKLVKEKNGKKKIMQIYRIKNEKGYPELLKE
ncbi:MAG: hypothetical protein Q8L34_05535 [Candidatus Woesearchaeota archaeon]|nr:hypothetical protein [Candidatus Woesearchaeota archaeon]